VKKLHCFHQMRFRSFCYALALGSIAAITDAQVKSDPPARPSPVPQTPIDFNRDVQPLFQKRCYECHGEKKQKSGLRLDRKSSVFTGGDSGKPAVMPGKSTESPLFQRVTSDDQDEVMPPKGERLTAEQLSLLKAWIDQGASWPAEAIQEKKHWAYEKPRRPSLPKVNRTQWPRNSIDYFVLARLEAEKLQPSPEADRAVLIRRLGLDLTGLPPTLEEVDAFLHDQNPNAYEKLVDRLLTSPHYGERWARPWLDLARYADTQGYEKDDRRTIWPYRDWVINALNRDLPFDQFTIEQIAGDMLSEATRDQKIATGFHRNTLTNTEGGTDDEEFRYEAVVDRVNTTMSVWMGSTFGCAQCHNHKYDPITTKEYYQFFAFLNNTADSDKPDEKPTLKLPTPSQAERLAKLQAELTAAEKNFKEAAAEPEVVHAYSEWVENTTRALTNWQVLDPSQFSSAGGATLTKTESKSILATGKNPSNDTYTVTAPAAPGKITGFRLEALETGEEKEMGRHENGGFVLTKFEAAMKAKDGDTLEPIRLKSATADYSQKNFDVTNILAGTGQGWSVGASVHTNRMRRSAYFTVTEPFDLPDGAMLTFTLRHSEKQPGANIMRFRLYSTTGDEVGPPASVPSDVRIILRVAAETRNDKQRERIKDYFESIASELKTVRDELAAKRKAESDFDKTIPFTSVMVEMEKPRETHMHIRGGFLSKGEKVAPGTPAVFHPFPADQPLNRLGLAHWLIDTNNPLTARVIVNRIWEQYFGKGIVETVEDFGVQGEPPSHPELLDWLATEFMQESWSMKRLHKLIAMSATYRQSSHVTPELYQRDPYNRLFARGPRVRLEAEMIRDQALAVSGLLAPKFGGPSVMPPQPEGLWQVVYNDEKWETSKGSDKYRRALYTFWRRTSPHPAMTTFDAPSREFCVLKRSRSNTPLQALTTLNDPAFVEAAQALARRVAAKTDCDLNQRAIYAFRLCLARPPEAKEVERLVTLYESEWANFKQDRKAAQKMATSELGQAPEGMDVAELAAWTVVANVLLNLDEMITKG
jgi:hypothetical protein